MGNTDSKQALKQGIFRLSSIEPIASNDPYWRGFYELPTSADDVFSIFTATDVRRARDSSLKNIETLIRTLTLRLFRLRQHKSIDEGTAIYLRGREIGRLGGCHLLGKEEAEEDGWESADPFR